MVAQDPAELIALRNRWIGAQAMAVALEIDRTTLWKREKFPETAPDGFWAKYAAELQKQLGSRAEEAAKAARLVAQTP